MLSAGCPMRSAPAEQSKKEKQCAHMRLAPMSINQPRDQPHTQLLCCHRSFVHKDVRVKHATGYRRVQLQQGTRELNCCPAVCCMQSLKQKHPSPAHSLTLSPVSLHSASGSLLILLPPTSNSVRAVSAPISGGRDPRLFVDTSSCCKPCRSWTDCGMKVRALPDRLMDVRWLNWHTAGGQYDSWGPWLTIEMAVTADLTA